MSKPPRLAILLCDTPINTVFAKHGDYQSIFYRFFQNAHPTKAEFTLDPYDVVHKMEYPDEDQIDSYDGIVLTGSASTAHYDLEWINKLIVYVARIANTKPRIKIIGICFGHQIVARALGGECVRNDGKWEVGPTAIGLTELGKEVFGVEELNIQEMHQDHVPSVPRTFHLLGSTPISPNQGMVRFYSPPSTESDNAANATVKSAGSSLENIHIISLQGHPEFTESIMSAIVERRASTGVISPEIAAQAESRKNWRNDGVEVVGKAIWEVLGVGA